MGRNKGTVSTEISTCHQVYCSNQSRVATEKKSPSTVFYIFLVNDSQKRPFIFLKSGKLACFLLDSCFKFPRFFHRNHRKPRFFHVGYKNFGFSTFRRKIHVSGNPESKWTKNAAYDRFCNLCKRFVMEFNVCFTYFEPCGFSSGQLAPAEGSWMLRSVCFSMEKGKSMCFSRCTGQPTLRSGHLHISM